MTSHPVSEGIPIHPAEYGRLGIGNTRILPDLIIYACWRGETPETMIGSYPTLSLDMSYLAIGC